MESSRSSSDFVPDFLHQRPKAFVLHALKRLAPRVLFPSGYQDEIQKLGEGLFLMPSTTKEEFYTVSLQSPSCSCADWSSHHLPCKHILFLLQKKFASWDDMPSGYSKNPVFIIDDSLLQKASVVPPKEATLTEEEVPIQNPVSGNESGPSSATGCRDILKKLIDITYLLAADDSGKMRKLGLVLENAINSVEKDLPTASGLVKNAPLPKPKKQKSRKEKTSKKTTIDNEQDKVNAVESTCRYGNSKSIDHR